MMKVIAYILSFIVLVLAITPCIDGLLDVKSQKIELAQKTTDHDHDNNQDQGAGHCSPFCVCQCCQSSFFLSFPVVSSPSNSVIISYYEYPYNLYNAELFDFPKPPKA